MGGVPGGNTSVTSLKWNYYGSTRYSVFGMVTVKKRFSFRRNHCARYNKTSIPREYTRFPLLLPVDTGRSISYRAVEC